MQNKPLLYIVTTIPLSLIFFKGQITFLKNKFDIKIISSEGHNLFETAKNENVEYYIVNMKREISFLNDMISLMKFIILFFKKRPDILHGSTPKAGLLSMFSGFITNIKVRIYYIHGLRYEGESGIKKKLLMNMERLSCFFATDIISVSQGVKEKLIEDKITKKKINLIGYGSINGVDINFFSKTNEFPEILTELGFSANDFVFGFVGRIVKDKGINELVKTFLKINDEFANAKLLLIGGFEEHLNPIDDDIRNEILNNPNIKYLGFKNDIRPYLSIMNVFVFPSYREGFGVSLIEAQSMEIPCIASDISGCNEIIENGKNGLLIQPRSTDSLYNAMKALIIDDDLLNKMGTNAKIMTTARYKQIDVWNKTLSLYSQLLENT